MDANTTSALNNFVALAQAMIDNHMSTNLPNLPREVLTIEPGRKYARIVRERVGGQGGSVFCFVDLTNGDVLKSASWRAPAKGARGNIFDQDPTAGINPYGANYLR